MFKVKLVTFKVRKSKYLSTYLQVFCEKQKLFIVLNKKLIIWKFDRNKDKSEDWFHDLREKEIEKKGWVSENEIERELM